ncbi:hypothetical protein RHS01_10184 [Rhizoctonia solani]|uniref:Uncharacterized protein n=1 Tax=Rhizoctonia solani TaxID=456999 RepID=A0A8H7I567_9AGAM|nr:hypothetical protein RHS01_10184 [Rhizoctonia solani]
MSSELFDYIEAVKPSLGDAKRAKVGLILIHYITLARVSHGRVRIDTVLTTSGESFVQKVLRNMAVIRGLGFALKVDMTARTTTAQYPRGLRRLCVKYGIDSDECLRRNKAIEGGGRPERDVGPHHLRPGRSGYHGALHEDTLRGLDESYVGHRPADTGLVPSGWDLPRSTSCRRSAPGTSKRPSAPARCASPSPGLQQWRRLVPSAATTPISQRRDEASTRGRLAESRRRYPGPVSSNIKPQDINDPMDTLLEALVALLLHSGGLLGEVLAGTRSGLGLVICSTLVLVWFSWGSTPVLLCFYSGALLVRRRDLVSGRHNFKQKPSSGFFEILALENDEAMQGTYHLFRYKEDGSHGQRQKVESGQGRMAGEGTREGDTRLYAPLVGDQVGD